MTREVINFIDGKSVNISNKFSDIHDPSTFLFFKFDFVCILL